MQDNQAVNPKSKTTLRTEIYDWLETIVGALLLCLLLFMFVLRLVSVSGTSMVPTLHHADRIVVSGLFYQPKPGDVVVLQTDTYGDELLVKRVIAVGGQTIDIDFDNGIVYVDGAALDEPYIAEPTREPEQFTGEITVPEGQIFVMGDNRNHSLDSRSSVISCVDARSVMGRVYWILIPARDEYAPRDWSRFGKVV